MYLHTSLLPPGEFRIGGIKQMTSLLKTSCAFIFAKEMGFLKNTSVAF